MSNRVPGAILAILALLGSLGAGDLVIEVEAGRHDRLGTPIRVEVPKDPRQVFPFGTLEDLETRRLVPGQLHGGELAWNLDRPLPAGSKRRYRFRSIPNPKILRDLPPTILGSAFVFTPTGSRLDFVLKPDVLRLTLDGRPVLTYHTTVAEPPPGIDPLYRRGGFLHPLATRSGLVVSDDFPPDHAHQHGLFFAWVDTLHDGRKVDFWNQQDRTGRVGPKPGDPGPTFDGGPARAEFAASLRHDALNTPDGPEPVLDETWLLRAYDIPGLVVFDFESRQGCAGAKPLKVLKYHYGGLGFRGARSWLDPEARGEDPPDPARSGRAEFLTAEGRHRKDGNQTRPRWVDLSGEVDGKLAGVAILDHPGNFRHPQPVRLHPNKPYFSFAPAALGDFEIAPGQVYVSRYRVILHDGRPDPKLIGRLWDDYAEPPTARIVEE